MLAIKKMVILSMSVSNSILSSNCGEGNQFTYDTVYNWGKVQWL